MDEVMYQNLGLKAAFSFWSVNPEGFNIKGKSPEHAGEYDLEGRETLGSVGFQSHEGKGVAMG